MSALSQHVSLTITADVIGIAQAGFGIALVLSCNASFPEHVRFYGDLPGVAGDFATDSPEYLAARTYFSQSPHPEQICIGRAVGKPTQKYRIDVSAVTVGKSYKVNVAGEGVTATTVSYTALADFNFVDGDVTVGTDAIAETAHGMLTGDGPYRVANAGGALPTGLAADTDYWIIKVDADSFKLATSKANALAATPVDITAAAGGGTHTLQRAQNDVICAQLVQGLNAVVGKNFTAAQQAGAGETDYIEVTADAAGEWFSLEITDVSILKIAQTHAEPAPALATDLDAILLENNDWYGLITLYNSDAYVKAAALWAESQTKIYIADLSASETVTLAVNGGDTADALKTSAYARTAVMYHPSPAAMAGAAWLGKIFPIDPGEDDWKWQTLATVTPVSLTSTHEVNLRAKHANTIQTVAGKNITWEGTTADGDFIDVTRGIDWLEQDMQTAVFLMLSNGKKIPYTNAGLALIEAEIRGSLKRAVRNGILDGETDFVITMPSISDVSANDRALRKLPGVKWSARLAGAVHKVEISGVVSV